MVCQECAVRADEKAAGWRAYRADFLDEDSEPTVLVYCPVCAEREFGPVAGIARLEADEPPE
jgi:hypothetical protein